jgi:hypothetical protein
MARRLVTSRESPERWQADQHRLAMRRRPRTDAAGEVVATEPHTPVGARSGVRGERRGRARRTPGGVRRLPGLRDPVCDVVGRNRVVVDGVERQGDGVVQPVGRPTAKAPGWASEGLWPALSRGSGGRI